MDILELVVNLRATGECTHVLNLMLIQCRLRCTGKNSKRSQGTALRPVEISWSCPLCTPQLQSGWRGGLRPNMRASSWLWTAWEVRFQHVGVPLEGEVWRRTPILGTDLVSILPSRWWHRFASFFQSFTTCEGEFPLKMEMIRSKDSGDDQTARQRAAPRWNPGGKWTRV